MANAMAATVARFLSRQRQHLFSHKLLLPIRACPGTFSKPWEAKIDHTNCRNPVSLGFVRAVSDGRPRGPLWRSRKVMSKEAMFVIQELKRARNHPDPARLSNFLKTHVSRLLKMDILAVLGEFQRQQEVSLALKIFDIVKTEPWHKPDVYVYKDLIVMLAKSKRMEEAMEVWKEMKKEGLEPDMKTYTEVIRGFLQSGCPADAMNLYEEMKRSPLPPEELPFRVLMKALFPHPLLRNKVKQDFVEIFPDRHVYDPPEEIFGTQ